MQRFLIPSISKLILDCDFERCLGLTLGREVERFLFWALPSSRLVLRNLKTLLTSPFALFKVVDILESSRVSVFEDSRTIAFVRLRRMQGSPTVKFAHKLNYHEYHGQTVHVKLYLRLIHGTRKVR
jgi:hypothetical protein